MDFTFDFRPHPNAQKRPQGAPFRIVVLSDLSGRGSRGERRETVGKPLKIDLDNFDAIFTRLKPTLDLSLHNSPPIRIEFEDEDGFHPDELYERLDLFQKSRGLRERLSNSATFEAAAAEIKAIASEPADASAPSESAGTPEPVSDLERLLGGTPNAHKNVGGTMGVFDAFLKNVVGPHIVAAPDPRQDELISHVDETIVAEMRDVLHHPSFQRLEASWRQLREMVNQLELDETLELFVLDLSLEELVLDLASADTSSVHRRLVTEGSSLAGEAPWSLIVVDFDIGGLDPLAALGALGAAAGGPALIGAPSHWIGAKTWAESGDWAATEDWSTLVGHSAAAYLAVCAPRVLVRLPYGAATDEIDSFTFEEMPSTRPHDSFLWGSSAFPVARQLAIAATRQGGRFGPDGLTIAGLPVHHYKDEDGDTQMVPCAEKFLTEAESQTLRKLGFIPVRSIKNRDAASIECVQTVNGDTLPGPWQG